MIFFLLRKHIYRWITHFWIVRQDIHVGPEVLHEHVHHASIVIGREGIALSAFGLHCHPVRAYLKSREPINWWKEVRSKARLSAFIVTYCAIEFSMPVYACCVLRKRPRRYSLEIALVTIKCETFMSVLYVMLKPGLIRGSVVTLVALVHFALVFAFSMFPYLDFVCSFKVTLITTISNSLMY